MRPLTFLLLPLLVVALAACDFADGDDAPSSTATAPLAHETVDEEAGNNLSFPVIWSDRVALPLGWAHGKEQFSGHAFETDGEMWYIQQDPLNKWQAQSAVPSPSHNRLRGFTVSAVDWGDNLEARDWTYGRPVRVEVALYKTLDKPMTAYTMRVEDPTVHGPGEVWGTNGVTYATDTSLVYSAAAQLVIQKLTKTRDDPTLTVTWAGDEWTGDVDAPIFRQGVWDASESGFNAEVNAQGRVIYGFNWRPLQGGAGAGDYRITFVLQKDSPIPLNTFFDSQTAIVVSDEHFALPTAGVMPGSGGTPFVEWRSNLTYIDVRITGGPSK